MTADTQDLLRLAEAPVPAKDMAAIYVMLSDDSQFIRKWSRKPFFGATAFYAAGFPAPARAHSTKESDNG